MKTDCLKVNHIRRRPEDEIYHNTLLLLSKYRDVTWSLELSVEHIRQNFHEKFGQTIESFLDSIYSAGADLSGTDIESHARSIERSWKMLKLVDSAVELLRSKHRYGEQYYWILYFTYLTPQEYLVEEVLEKLQPYLHGRYICRRTYYDRRRKAVSALGDVLWGYTSRDCLNILEYFIPNT